ncbi:hypothetical protein RhiirA5_438357 [Rhizophagus irregularis]|uniref:Uncharacterized protein n=1 Tax=Rhizophagus irregularis TaxID=588596 RepID=A0A2N0NJ82_9GLOM|nr:hypothetical protein RhiirA5_438357 [Rhizophagus irregularis]
MKLLALEICKIIRPEINEIEAPKNYIDLMNGIQTRDNVNVNHHMTFKLLRQRINLKKEYKKMINK